MSSIFALVGASGPDRTPASRQAGEPNPAGVPFETFLEAARTQMDAQTATASEFSSPSVVLETESISEGDGLGGGVGPESSMGEEMLFVALWKAAPIPVPVLADRAPEIAASPSTLADFHLSSEDIGPESGTGLATLDGNLLGLEGFNPEADPVSPDETSPERRIGSPLPDKITRKPETGSSAPDETSPERRIGSPLPDKITRKPETGGSAPDGLGNSVFALDTGNPAEVRETGTPLTPPPPEGPFVASPPEGESSAGRQTSPLDGSFRNGEKPRVEKNPSAAPPSDTTTTASREARLQTRTDDALRAGSPAAEPVPDETMVPPLKGMQWSVSQAQTIPVEDDPAPVESPIPEAMSVPPKIFRTPDDAHETEAGDVRSNPFNGAGRDVQRKSRPLEARKEPAVPPQTMSVDPLQDVQDTSSSSPASGKPEHAPSREETPRVNASRQERRGEILSVAASLAGMSQMVLQSSDVRPSPAGDPATPGEDASPETDLTDVPAGPPERRLESRAPDPGTLSETDAHSLLPKSVPGDAQIATERPAEEPLRPGTETDIPPQNTVSATATETLRNAISPRPERNGHATGTGDRATAESMRREGSAGKPQDRVQVEATKAQKVTPPGKGAFSRPVVESSRPSPSGTFPPATAQGEALQADLLNPPDASGQIGQIPITGTDGMEDAIEQATEDAIEQAEEGIPQTQVSASGPGGAPPARPEEADRPAARAGTTAPRKPHEMEPSSQAETPLAAGEIHARSKVRVGKIDRSAEPPKKPTGEGPAENSADRAVFTAIPHAPVANSPADHRQDVAPAVEVLSSASSAHADSRMPAENPSQTSPTLPDDPAVPRAVVNQVLRGARFLLQDNVSEVRVRLEPPELGSVHIRIVSEKESLSGEITVSSHEIKGIVESNLHQLRSSLTDQGLQVGRIDVAVRDDRESGRGFNLAGEFRQGNPQDQRGNPGQNRSPDWTRQEDPRPRPGRSLVDYFA